MKRRWSFSHRLGESCYCNYCGYWC